MIARRLYDLTWYLVRSTGDREEVVVDGKVPISSELSGRDGEGVAIDGESRGNRPIMYDRGFSPVGARRRVLQT